MPVAIDDVVKRIQDLPSLSAVVLELLVPALDLDTWNALGLSESDSMVLFAQTEATFQDMCQILIH